MDIREPIERGIESSTSDALDLFVPEALLPEQYFARSAVRTSSTPEKRLMFAVLLDGALQLQSSDPDDAAEAARWISETKDIDAPFSFHSICEALEIEPSSLACGLLSKRNGMRAMLRLRQARVGFPHVAPPRPSRRRASHARSSKRPSTCSRNARAQGGHS